MHTETIRERLEAISALADIEKRIAEIDALTAEEAATTDSDGGDSAGDVIAKVRFALGLDKELAGGKKRKLADVTRTESGVETQQQQQGGAQRDEEADATHGGKKRKLTDGSVAAANTVGIQKLADETIKALKDAPARA